MVRQEFHKTWQILWIFSYFSTTAVTWHVSEAQSMLPIPLQSQTTTAFVMLSILRSGRPFAPAAPTVLRRKLTLLVNGLSRLEDDKAWTATSGYLIPWNDREGPRCRRASGSFAKVKWMNQFHSSATTFQSLPLVSSSEAVDQELTDTIDEVRCSITRTYPSRV